jgi:hypothetical protein
VLPTEQGSWQATQITKITGYPTHAVPSQDASGSNDGNVIFIPGQSAPFWSVMESPHILSAVSSGSRRRSASSCQLQFSYIIYSSDAQLTLSVYERQTGKQINKIWSDTSTSVVPVNWRRATNVAVTMQSNFRVDIVANQEGNAKDKTGYFAVDQISFTGCVFAEIAINASTYSYSALTTGCADGEREAFMQDPGIAGCEGNWQGYADLADAPSGVPCGDDFPVDLGRRMCTSPADLCDTRNGWHICGSTGNVQDITSRTDAGACYSAGYGRYSAAIDNCNEVLACDKPNLGIQYQCSQFKQSCDAPFCCGSACTGNGTCDGGVFLGKTMSVPNLKSYEGCAHITDDQAGGVLCCYDPMPTAKPSPSCKLCTLEKDSCDWSLINGGASWKRAKGEIAPPSTPRFDYTIGNQKGTYLYLSLGKLGGQAILQTGWIYPSKENCSHCRLQFYYHSQSQASNPSSLEVHFSSPSLDKQLWSKTASDSEPGTWQKAVVDINTPASVTRFRIIISAFQGSNGGDISLDDISFLPCEVIATTAMATTEKPVSTTAAPITTSNIPSMTTEYPSTTGTVSKATTVTPKSETSTGLPSIPIIAGHTGSNKDSNSRRNAGIAAAVIIVIAIVVGIVLYVLWSRRRSRAVDLAPNKQQSSDIGINNPVYGYTEHQTVDVQNYDVAEYDSGKGSTEESKSEGGDGYKDPYDLIEGHSDTASDKGLVV